MCFENQAYERMYKKDKQKPEKLHDFLGKAYAKITYPFRFGGQINTSVRKKNVNLIPFPRLKYFAAGFSCEDEKHPISSAFKTKNRLILKDMIDVGYIMGAWINVRGDPLMYEQEVERIVKKEMKLLKSRFTEWIPYNIHLSVSN